MRRGHSMIHLRLEATSIASDDCFDIQAPTCLCADPGPLFSDAYAMSASQCVAGNNALWASEILLGWCRGEFRGASWASDLRSGGA